ncbi:MAG: hypothetical protein KDD61_04735 [Bdellovibrionales bacterium]|nr:hypothetical protein [Bdellovibrionales bacterium]
MKFFLSSFVLALFIIEGFYVFVFSYPDFAKHLPDPVLIHLRSYYWSSPYRKMIQFDRSCSQYDPEVFYTLKPGNCRQANVEFSVEYKNNSIGVRDDEESLQQPDIIVLGDSQALGWGVEQEKRFSELIEKKTGLKVLNTGVSSYGTARELMLLRRLDTSKLKYLIIQHASNDRWENRYYLQHNLTKDPRTEKTWNRIAKEQESQVKYYVGKNLVTLIRLFFFPEPQRHLTMSIENEESEFIQIVDSLMLKKLRNIPILIFSVTVQRSEHSEFVANLHAMISKQDHLKTDLDFKFIDITSELNKDQYRNVIDNHLTAQGHQFIAEKILEFLPSKEI